MMTIAYNADKDNNHDDLRQTENMPRQSLLEADTSTSNLKSVYTAVTLSGFIQAQLSEQTGCFELPDICYLCDLWPRSFW